MISGPQIHKDEDNKSYFLIELTREELERARVKGKEEGIDITGDSGEFSRWTVRCKYAYDGSTGVLRVTIVDKGLMAWTHSDAKIAELVTEVIEDAAKEG